MEDQINYTRLTADCDRQCHVFESLMYDYIDCFGSEEMLEKFQQMKEDGTGFPAMKSWFLDQFPKFNVEKAKGDIKRYRLGHVKAKYKVAKTAPKNRKSTSNIADSPNQ